MTASCYLCGHPLYPQDKTKPIAICGVCKMSMSDHELFLAIGKRIVLICSEKENAKNVTGEI